MYLIDYRVDITTILSTSTLSMKIFRSKFLNVDIPIFKRLDDTFIRKSYFGGPARAGPGRPGPGLSN
jgi:hypothetical protein